MAAFRRRLLGSALLILVLGLSLSPVSGRDKHEAQVPGSQKPLAEILNPDGTLRLAAGVQGSFDPKGFQMVSGPGGEPAFVPIGSARQTAASVVAAASGDESWYPQFDGYGTVVQGPVRAIAVDGTNVYVGGEFAWVGDSSRTSTRHIARWNSVAGQWEALSGGLDNTVFAIAVVGTNVYAGGLFTHYFSVFHNEGGYWQSIGTNGTVYALAVSGTDVYVGGNFTSPSNHVAKWNGSSWTALSSGVNDLVLALAVSGTDVYVGGYFSDAGGFALADYVAKWNGSSWSALGSGVNGTVHALAASGSDVYVGGEFTTAGGSPAGYIAKWNGTGWSTLSSGLNYYPNVIVAKGLDVYAGGLFGQAGGVWLNCIAKWNGTGWAALGSGLDNQAFAIAAGGRNVYVGGFFLHAGGKQTYYFARWVEPLSVDSPNGGEIWEAGSSHAVTWTADASVGPVKIEYSTNNGSTWTTVTASTPNTGTYSWTVPNTPSATARVRISEAADGDPVDASDAAFAIAGFKVTAPGSGDTWTLGSQRTIAWSTVGSWGSVRIELSRNNGSTWETIVESTTNTGSYAWTVSGATTSQALIRISDPADGLPFGNSAMFSIIPTQALTVTFPNGGEILEAWTKNTITWTASASILNIRIQYSTDNGATWNLIMINTSNDGAYDWYPPNTLSNTCRVRVFDADDGDPVDMSDGVFTIAGFKMIAPYGYTWEPGSSQTIVWATLGDYPTVRLEYSPDGGTTWETITASAPNTGSYPWTVPGQETTNGRVRVSDAADGVPNDMGSLVIQMPPMIRVLTPNGGESWLAGAAHDITWTSTGITGLVRISYSTNNGGSFSMVAITQNDGSYTWTLPSVISSECLVQITDFYVVTDDTSDAVFSIVGAQTIAVTSPNGGESWPAGSAHDITWTQEGLSGSTVTINLRKDDSHYKQLGAVDAALRSFSWEIPADETPGTDYQINLYASGGIADDSNGYFSIVSAAAEKDDFIGTWDGQGVYYRNSDTAAWVKMASPATKITVGDLDGDGIDDLIGLWPGQGGIWVKYSQSGAWAKLSSTAEYICAGDMNGDGKADLVGTWDGQGVFYRDSTTGAWVKLATPATMVAAGDIDNDGIDDLIGLWPSQGGIWVKYSQTGTWAKLSSTAVHIAAGDMNGDKRDDLLGTWDGQGVYYRDSETGTWVKMASPATLITTGDIDGDETDDLIGIWPTQGGVWVKYSSDGTWERLSSTAQDIAAGKMRATAGGGEALAEGVMAAQQELVELPLPMGGAEEGPRVSPNRRDLSDRGPRGARFVYLDDINLEPGEEDSARLTRIPSPGEPGAKWVEQSSLFPQEALRKEKKTEARVNTKKIK